MCSTQYHHIILQHLCILLVVLFSLTLDCSVVYRLCNSLTLAVRALIPDVITYKCVVDITFTLVISIVFTQMHLVHCNDALFPHPESVVRLLSHRLNPPPNITWTREREISFLTLRYNKVTTWRMLQKELSLFCFFWWTTCITVINWKDQPNPKCRIAACLLGIPWCETTTKVSESGLLERSMCQFSVVACWWCEDQSLPSGRQVPMCGMWKGSEYNHLGIECSRCEKWTHAVCGGVSPGNRVSPTELTRVCERAFVLSSLSGGLPFCDASINSSSTSLGSALKWKYFTVGCTSNTAVFWDLNTYI